MIVECLGKIETVVVAVELVEQELLQRSLVEEDPDGRHQQTVDAEDPGRILQPMGTGFLVVVELELEQELEQEPKAVGLGFSTCHLDLGDSVVEVRGVPAAHDNHRAVRRTEVVVVAVGTDSAYDVEEVAPDDASDDKPAAAADLSTLHPDSSSLHPIPDDVKAPDASEDGLANNDLDSLAGSFPDILILSPQSLASPSIAVLIGPSRLKTQFV